MTHPLSPLVRAVLEKAAKACDKRAGNASDFDRHTRRAAGMCASDIRALDADHIAADHAHLVPGVGEVERLRAALQAIAAMETACANATVRNMANAARAAIQETRHDR